MACEHNGAKHKPCTRGATGAGAGSTKKVPMEYKTLSNGVKMPMLGYGVFQIDDATTERCVADAIASGYRMIDTAQAYGNERGVGAGIKASGVARDELFIVSKVWVSNYGEGKTYDSIKQSLELLGVDQIDLMLLHQAYNDYHAAWRDMERAYKDGLVRAIGVSNFDPRACSTSARSPRWRRWSTRSRPMCSGSSTTRMRTWRTLA